jgi:hypothetical protein
VTSRLYIGSHEIIAKGINLSSLIMLISPLVSSLSMI